MLAGWIIGLPLLVYAALFLLRLLLTLHNLLRIQIRYAGSRVEPEEQVPLYFREGLRAPMEQLQALGFAHVCWTRTQSMMVLTDEENATAWMWNAQSSTVASVGFTSVPEPLSLYFIAFQSLLPQDRSVLTINGVAHNMYPRIDGVTIVDPYASSVEEQLQAHAAAVARVGPAEALEPAAAVARGQLVLLGTQLDSAVKDGLLRPRADGNFEATWIGGLRLAFRAVTGLRRAQKRSRALALALRASGKRPPLPPVEVEVLSWRRQLAMSKAPPRRGFFWIVFAITIALFAIASAFNAGARIGIIVLGVLLFHEGGHWLAMRLRGYANTTIFFIPFVGGVSTGSKHDATLTDELIVLLAGPMPGLLVALALSLSGLAKGETMQSLLWVLVFLNLFNLIPVLPLDGGRIAQALFSARSSTLDVLSRLAGVALMGLLGFVFSSPLMIGIAVLQAIALPQGFRLAHLRRELAQRMSESQANWDAAPGIFFTLAREGDGARLPFLKRLGLARAVLLQPAQNLAPRKAAVAGWSVAYLGSVAAGVAALVGVSTLPSIHNTEGTAAARLPQRRDVAQLSCPASWSPAAPPTEARAVEEGMVPVGLAVFDRPIAGSDLAALDGVPEGKLRWSYGPLLMSFQNAEDYWADQRASAPPTASALQRATLAVAVHERGGRSFGKDDGLASPWLSCRAPDEQQAAQLAGTLEEFANIQPYVPAARPPWIAAPAEADASEARARRTLLLAMKARTTLPPARSLLRALWARYWRGGHKDKGDYLDNVRQQVKTALADARLHGEIDEEVARLIEGDPMIQSRQTRTALAARVGAVSVPAAPGSLLISFAIAHQASEVSLRLNVTNRDRLEADFPQIVGWLCSRQCTEPRLQLPEPRPERTAQLDRE